MPETFSANVPLLVIMSACAVVCPAGRLPNARLPNSPITAEGVTT